MKKIAFLLLIALLIIMLAACSPASSIERADEPAPAAEPDVGVPLPPDAEESPGEAAVQSDGLVLNRDILENIGRPFSGILRSEPGLKPQSLDNIDAAAVCFVDPGKPYSYILYRTQYLEFDGDAAEAIEARDILCEGIYTKASELFPALGVGEDPAAFFDMPGVENFYMDELDGWPVSYYAYFDYLGMRFEIWGGEEGAPPKLDGNDTATVTVTTRNEELINEYYNEKHYPGGIGCAEAINCARANRISAGKQDCDFYIMRDGIIDAWDEMGLADQKVYIVSPILDWEAGAAEKRPVYYVGFTTGEVYERLTSAD